MTKRKYVRGAKKRINLIREIQRKVFYSFLLFNGELFFISSRFAGLIQSNSDIVMEKLKGTWTKFADEKHFDPDDGSRVEQHNSVL